MCMWEMKGEMSSRSHKAQTQPLCKASHTVNFIHPLLLSKLHAHTLNNQTLSYSLCVVLWIFIRDKNHPFMTLIVQKLKKLDLCALYSTHTIMVTYSSTAATQPTLPDHCYYLIIAVVIIWVHVANRNAWVTWHCAVRGTYDSFMLGYRT